MQRFENPSRLILLRIAGLLALAIPATVGAASIVADNFDYPVGSTLDGMVGGSGWSGPWAALTESPVDPAVVMFEGSPAIRFNDGSGTGSVGVNEAAYRILDDPFAGNAFFLSFKVAFTGESPGFFALWMDTAESAGSDGPHNSGRLNVGTIDGHWVARAHFADGVDQPRIITGPEAAPGEVRHLVVRYSKSDPGLDAMFDTLAFWIDPGFEDLHSPVGALSGLSGRLNSLGSLGFRMNSVPGDTKYFVSDLKMVESWNDLGFKEPSRIIHLQADGQVESVAISPDSKIIDVAGHVSAASGPLSSTFQVSGLDPAHVLIRGLGPSLDGGNTLGDPHVTVTRLNGNHVLGFNDQWDPALAPLFRFLEVPELPEGSRDAAITLALPPGEYRVDLTGSDDLDTGSARISIHLDESAIYQTDVFVGGEGGYHTYRIPAMVVTPRGTVLLFCEGRKNSDRDKGDIDVLLRRSFDQGKSWMPAQFVHGVEGDITVGNPVPIVDRVTGDIHLVIAESMKTLFYLKSSDDGATFSDPVNITHAVQEMCNRAGFSWPGGHVLGGPGHGLQMRDGRLIVPVKPIGPVQNGSARRVGVLYSDDHGETWKGGGLVYPALGEMSESMVIERTDGSLLLNMRWHDGTSRAMSESFNGGRTWTHPVPVPELTDPMCQASMINFSYNLSQDDYRVLFSNLDHVFRGFYYKRSDLTVRLSRDDGKTWAGYWLVTAGPSGYSDLAMTPDGRMLLSYESGRQIYSEKITFARFDQSVFVTGKESVPTPLPRIASMDEAAGEVNIQWDSILGMTYEIQLSKDLRSWQTVDVNVGDGQLREQLIKREFGDTATFLRLLGSW
jgi:sialidase-1